MSDKEFTKYCDRDITPCYGRDIAGAEEPKTYGSFLEFYNDTKNHPPKNKTSLSNEDAFILFEIIKNMNNE